MSESGEADLPSWIERVKSDPVAYLERQVVEVILTAIAQEPNLREKIILKGGTLMGVVHKSPRQTSDLDFTTILSARQDKIHEFIRDSLNRQFHSAANRLGNPDLLVRIQSLQLKPRKDSFARKDFPALILKISYARRGSPEQRLHETGQGIKVIEVDISFNEPIGKTIPIRLGDDHTHILAYSLIDLLAEKYRAYLQQEVRKRNRRQDIFDIHHLLCMYDLTEQQKSALLETLKQKCQARGIHPKQTSLEDPGLIERARSEWHTQKLEVMDLPDFEVCFRTANTLYKNLPW